MRSLANLGDGHRAVSAKQPRELERSILSLSSRGHCSLFWAHRYFKADDILYFQVPQLSARRSTCRSAFFNFDNVRERERVIVSPSSKCSQKPLVWKGIYTLGGTSGVNVTGDHASKIGLVMVPDSCGKWHGKPVIFRGLDILNPGCLAGSRRFLADGCTTMNPFKPAL